MVVQVPNPAPKQAKCEYKDNMGIKTQITVIITKTCDGCGDECAATGRFSGMGSALAYGGPVEAADWKIHSSEDGVSLLCDRCAEHMERKTN